ncbi:lysophospholipase [Kribbella sp. NBC_00382]|uniref:alpha/beta fold hydrolase n=1 Tax=Kribbella sp. NBC_00382 TaxID=2975967 RepID=UPI002E1BE4AE
MTELTLTRPDAQLRGTATGTGPTLLLLHAGGEDRSVWAPVAGALSQREHPPGRPSVQTGRPPGSASRPPGQTGRPTGTGAGRPSSSSLRPLRTVAYDLRGHGESSGQATRLGPIAEDVTTMIRSEVGPVVLVGASLGGLAAIASLADPGVAQGVAGLILVDVVPNPDPVRVRAWLDDRCLRTHDPLVEDIFNHGPELLTTATMLKLPILIVRGGPTSPLTDAEVNRFRTANPAVAVTRVPTAGHLIAHDAPNELARIIADQAATWFTTDRTAAGG